MAIPDHKRIKPDENGISDFFSWNLYRWVKAHPDLCRVYKSNWNFWNGHKGGFKNGQIMIGHIDGKNWFSGRALTQVAGGRLVHPMAYPGGSFQTEKWRDITDEFWKRYLRIGVCALGQHRHKFKYEGEEFRVCKYCNRKEKRRTVMVPEYHWDKAA